MGGVVDPGVDALERWQLGKLGSANPLRGVPPRAGKRRPWDDEGWDANRRQDWVIGVDELVRALRAA